MEPTEILNAVLNHTDKSINGFAKAIGLLRSQNLYDIQKGKVKKISPELSEKIVTTFPEINRNFLLTGEGEMLNDDLTPDSGNITPYYVNVNASAGLNFITNNDGRAFEVITIPNVDADAFINVFGDSMYPRYLSGQIIGVKRIDKEYVMFGHAYVIQMMDGEAYLKYIKKGSDANHWVLDNENKKYDPREFHLSKIEKIFIIKAVITKTTL